MNLPNFFKGCTTSSIENDHESVTLFDSWVSWNIIFTCGYIPDLRLYVFARVPHESHSVLSFVCLPILPGEVIIHYSIEKLALPSAGEALQKNLECVLAFAPACWALLLGSCIDIERR